MSYLGRGLEQVDNISKLDNITFNGGTTYALTKDSAAFTPISSNAILISIDGVIQQGNFSVSGTNIVFNFSPTGSNTCDFILHYGTGVAFTPADNSITKDKTNFVSTSSSSGLQIKGDGTTDGTLQLNCSQNSHGVKIKSPAHSAGQSYTLTLPTTAPASNKIMQTDGSGNLSFVDKPSGGLTLLSMIDQDLGTGNKIQFQQVFSSDYDYYKVIGSFSLGSTGSHDIEFRWLNSSNAEQTASEYYGVAQGWRYNSGANDRSDWGQWQATGVDFVRDVAGGAYYRKVVLEMDLHPDAYASTTYSALQWSAGYFKYQGASESVSHITGYGAYAQTTDLSGGGFQLETNNNYDFVNMGVYGVKTTT